MRLDDAASTHRIRLIALLLSAATVVALMLPVAAGASPATEPGRSAAAASPDYGQQDSSHGLVLRRDGSKAVPFVADVGPKAPTTAGGFAWGDAAIGAGSIIGAMALGLAGILGFRWLRARPDRPRMPAASGS